MSPSDSGGGLSVSVNPFLERLREHAVSVGVGVGVESAPLGGGRPVAAPDVGVPAATTSLAQAPPKPRQLAFWQSPIARAVINRRVSGDPELAPEVYLARRHGALIPAAHTLSLRASDAKLELALVESGGCERVSGLDEQQTRIDFANGRVPEPLRERVKFGLGSIERWEPPEPLGAVVCRSFLHRQEDLEAVLDRLATLLVPGGLVFVEDFVGPARFQWTDLQLEWINRLLARLPDELLVDLAADDGRRKRTVERPDPQDWMRANPGEAVRSDEILGCLDTCFERVEVRPVGGALFHQLFSRIMGNFVGRPELVGMLMEVDALLTDSGVVESDYVWGVWQKR
jgi:SAM-dependent methyltransferase